MCHRFGDGRRMSHPGAWMVPMERAVAKLAERQHGVFTLAQVIELGGTKEAAWHRLRSGRWESVRAGGGVYRLAGTSRTWEQDLMAVVLATGPDAAVSHRSAAALLGISGFRRSGVPEVTTPRAQRHRHASAVVHRSRSLPAEHLSVVNSIAVTRAARTLVDLAAVLHPLRTQRAVDNCLSGGKVRLDDLRTVTWELAGRGRSGIGLMRAILEAREPGFVAVESELEARFSSLVEMAGLPPPRRQVEVGDAESWVGRVDFAYSQHRLLIELDGRRHHTGLLDREADRYRDNRLVAAGWRVVRITWSDLTTRPEQVVSLLRKLLSHAADGPHPPVASNW